MRPTLSNAICLMASILGCIPAAQAAICEINLAGRMGIDQTGGLFVDMKGAGIVQVCSMSNQYGSITKDGCTAWYSLLITYKASGKRALFYFSDANPLNAGVTTCDQLGDWTNRAPYFLETVQ